MGVGGVGGGDDQDVAAEVLERFGVEGGGLLEQVAFGLLGELGVEVGGQVREGAEDGLGLLDVETAGGEGGAGQVVGLKAGGEPHRPVGLDPGGAGGVGVPVRGRGRPGVGGELDLVGVGQESGFELGELGLGSQHLVDDGGGLGRVHRPDRDGGDRGQCRACVSDGGGHPVGVLRDR